MNVINLRLNGVPLGMDDFFPGMDFLTDMLCQYKIRIGELGYMGSKFVNRQRQGHDQMKQKLITPYHPGLDKATLPFACPYTES